MRIFLIVFLSAVSLVGFSQSTRLFGADTAYIGQEIIFNRQLNPITFDDEELARCMVDSNGYFELQFELSETTFIYCELGVYKFIFYAEPSMEYELALPEFAEKNNTQKYQPFFEPTVVHLGTIEYDKNELNMQIRMFEDSFKPYNNKHILVQYGDADLEQLDKDIESIEKSYTRSKNKFFNDYRKYRYGLLRFYAYQHKSKSVSDLYFANQEVLYKHPAYVELFHAVYKQYFRHFTRTTQGAGLGAILSKEYNYTQITELLAKDKVLQPADLLNLVLLKSIHDEFYQNNYSRRALLNTLTNFIDSTQSHQQVVFAKQIKTKLLKLMSGNKPPNFQLYDIDSNLVSLNKFEGKYVYLNFCTCFNYSCLTQYGLLKNLYEKHKQYLEIVTIILDEDVAVMKDFITRSGYNWTFLHYGNMPEITKDYDIRGLPVYYLIDNEGKLVLSPAPTPNDEFEMRLFKQLRARGIL